MWSRSVVVELPRLDLLSGILETDKPVLIETLVSQPAIEALDESVLHGLARANEIQPTLRLCPAVERFP